MGGVQTDTHVGTRVQAVHMPRTKTHMQGACMSTLVHTLGEVHTARPALRTKVGQREPGPAAAPLTAHPTLCPGRLPPEDDEYSEYSEYSVDEYEDLEALWEGDGEDGGAEPMEV